MANFSDKEKQIRELLAQKDEIDRKLQAILEPRSVAVLPRGFSINVEVFRLIKESGDSGISAQELLHSIQKQYGEGIDRKKVASSLAYLKNTKETIEQTGRGVYRAKTETPKTEVEGVG